MWGNITHFFKLSCSDVSSALSFGAYSNTMSERFAFLLHYRQTKTRHHQRPRVTCRMWKKKEEWFNFLLKSSNLADLWTFSGWSLSFQPALDAREAKEVSAAQGRQPVFARCRPRLKADGAVVAFALLAVRWRDRSRGHRERLQVDMKSFKQQGHWNILNYRFKMRSAWDEPSFSIQAGDHDATETRWSC